MLHRFTELLFQVCAFPRIANKLGSKRPCHNIQVAQHHFRVGTEVAVHGHMVVPFPSVLIRISVCVQQVCLYPFRQRLTLHPGNLSLLQENNVHRYIRPGIGPESGVWQADRAQQVAAPGHIFPGVCILFIHRAATDAVRGDESDNAACPHLVDGLGKEVVVDQQVVPVIGPVTHPVVAKRYISNGKVENAVGVLRFLKAVDLDAGIGIKLPCDAPGDAVQLYAVQAAPGHAIRQHPKEVAYTAGRF